MENITVNMDNLTESERKTLVGLIEKANENKNGKPNEGDEYFLICNAGDVTSNYWGGDQTDSRRFTIGNVFRTKEEAEFTVEKLKVLAELKRLANASGAMDWKNSCTSKFHLIYRHDDGSIKYEENQFVQQAEIYFATKQAALDAIQTIGADRIKKYLFGVEV